MAAPVNFGLSPARNARMCATKWRRSTVSAGKLLGYTAHQEDGAVQLQGLGLKLHGPRNLRTETKAHFHDPLIRVAAMSDANSNSTVLVIDDDPDLRASVGLLLESLGMEVQLFASISDFLKSDPPNGPACLVLDVRLPGQSGLDLQRELALAKRELPIIFITG